MTLQLAEAAPGVTVATRSLGSFGDVKAVLVAGTRRRALLDALPAPADIAPLAPADYLVYTHADWDHVWGAPALPNALRIGHRRCRERMLADDGQELREYQAKDPDAFAGAAVLPPELTFDHSLALDLGAMTLELHHLPGHTEDELVAWVPERSLLIAGDAAESPLPVLEVPGDLRKMARLLRTWAERAEVVVPMHGPISGPALLWGNADYIEELLAAAGAALQAGWEHAELLARCPMERFVTNSDAHPAFYRGAHSDNLKMALQAVRLEAAAR